MPPPKLNEGCIDTLKCFWSIDVLKYISAATGGVNIFEV